MLRAEKGGTRANGHGERRGTDPLAALSRCFGRGRRVAIVHDWLVTFAGAERVLEQLLKLFPDADVYTVLDLLPPESRGFLNGAEVHTTFLQKVPGLRRRHRALLPFMPFAIEQLDVSGHDLVVSSSHAVAKGVITGPEQLHLCYCHSPMRYAWDLQHEYLREARMRRTKEWLARWHLHRMRIWDVRTANGVDEFAANSRYIAKRLHKVYRRDAQVIHPPVDVDAFPLRLEKDDFYLAASRMVPYKRMPLLVEAFRAMPDRRLVVIGDGPELARVRRIASANIEVLGWQPFEVLRDHMQRARAFVFAAEEDFGITPVEAMACGTPVIAYGHGGVRESVIDGVTGLFFDTQTVPAIAEALHRFEADADRFEPETIRRRAELFAAPHFRRRFAEFAIHAWSDHADSFDGALRPVSV
jgi:glycosyltransferase involved in cell wall biosynthesis